jgi:hypothetical protein
MLGWPDDVYDDAVMVNEYRQGYNSNASKSNWEAREWYQQGYYSNASKSNWEASEWYQQGCNGNASYSNW